MCDFYIKFNSIFIMINNTTNYYSSIYPSHHYPFRNHGSTWSCVRIRILPPRLREQQTRGSPTLNPFPLPLTFLSSSRLYKRRLQHKHQHTTTMKLVSTACTSCFVIAGVTFDGVGAPRGSLSGTFTSQTQTSVATVWISHRCGGQMAWRETFWGNKFRSWSVGISMGIDNICGEFYGYKVRQKLIVNSTKV